MKIESLSTDFSVRALTMDDIDMLYDMMCENVIFYEYHPPFVTRESIARDMKALPPNKGYEDKFYIGFFRDDTLMANMDLILGFPTDKIAFIGWFMTNTKYQNKGMGTRIISDTCKHLKDSGFEKVRLGVDKGNEQSYSFWRKNGFQVIDEDEYLLMEFSL